MFIPFAAQADKEEISTPEIDANLAGRALYDAIEKAGSAFSDKAASELAAQLTTSCKHHGESVENIISTTQEF